MAEKVYPNWTQVVDDPWSDATAYVTGDRVLREGVSYHCILAHTNQQPPNAIYWTPRYLVRISHYTKIAQDFDAATVKTVYEDQGADFNYSAEDVAQEWELRYSNKGSQEQLQLILAFYAEHKLVLPFTFVEPRGFPFVPGQEGLTATGVRFARAPEYDHQKVNINNLSVRLIRHP